MAGAAGWGIEIAMARLKPILGTSAFFGILCLVLAHAWATRAIEPQLAQDNGRYCRNWQVQLDVKISDFNSTCTRVLERTGYTECSKRREDLAAQTTRFNRNCSGLAGSL